MLPYLHFGRLSLFTFPTMCQDIFDEKRDRKVSHTYSSRDLRSSSRHILHRQTFFLKHKLKIPNRIDASVSKRGSKNKT